MALLAGLLSHPYITVLRYSDDGPPESVTRIDHPLRPPAAQGWIEVGPEDGAYRMFPVTSCDDTIICETGIIGDFVPAAESDDATDAYPDLSPEQAAARRRADAIALCAASMSGAHMYITLRDFLLRVTWDLSKGVLVSRAVNSFEKS